MEIEALIVAKHNLDLSSLEALANDIANRLNVNIDFGNSNLTENGYEFQLLGNISKNQSNFFCTLYDVTNDFGSVHDYVLEIGEHAKLIYTDIISVLPPWEVYFADILSQYNQDILKNSAYYANVVNELMKLGADEILFINENEDLDFQITPTHRWETYNKLIQEKSQYFKLPLGI